jgi:hypothetical protein
VGVLTDVEISRALNALSTTLRDQRPPEFDAGRAQEIVLGALAHEPKIEALATGPFTGELRKREDGKLIALVHMREGQWVIERKLRAGESSWALPQPAHSEQASDDGGQGEGEQGAEG